MAGREVVMGKVGWERMEVVRDRGLAIPVAVAILAMAGEMAVVVGLSRTMAVVVAQVGILVVVVKVVILVVVVVALVVVQVVVDTIDGQLVVAVVVVEHLGLMAIMDLAVAV